MVIKIDERSDEHTFGYSSEVGSGSNRKQVKFYLIYGKLQNIFCFIEYDFLNLFVIISLISWFMCLIL